MNDLQIVAAYSGFLAEVGVRHVVGGSLASSAWGEQRSTNDADFLLRFTGEQLEGFLVLLPHDFTVEEAEVRASSASTEAFASFQARYEPSVFKIDNFIANDQWQLEQLDRAKPLELLKGSAVPFASAEDMIVAKCRWFDLGNRVSDRQWNDLVRLYEVQRMSLETSYIERWLTHFDLMDLWQEIQRQARA